MIAAIVNYCHPNLESRIHNMTLIAHLFYGEIVFISPNWGTKNKVQRTKKTLMFFFLSFNEMLKENTAT